MKLPDLLLLLGALLLFIIGVHQTYLSGAALGPGENNFAIAIYQNYWLFMLSLGCVLWFRTRRAKALPASPEPAIPPKKLVGKSARKPARR